MAISRNRFNDPALGEVFSNIASLFAPPSASDVASYAQAAATQQKASMIAQLVSNPNGPDFDRLNIALGNYAPSQSFYSVDQGNAVTRRGQDISARTSLTNNQADNARALEDRRMQEAAAMDRLRITDTTDRRGQDLTAQTSRQNNAADNRRATVTSMFQPLSQGQVRPAVPDTIAAMLDLPAMPAQTGAPIPLSATQVEAQERVDLRNRGLLSDQDLVDAIVGKETPVQIVGPNNKPQFSTPGAAVRIGASPYEAAKTERMDNFLAVGPNGEERRFVGYAGADGKIYDVSTQQVVPNVVRKESTGGGMSFETDGNGGIRLSTGNAAGNTTARVTDLQRQEAEAGRSVSELTALFDTLRQDDLGLAGNLNQFLTDYGAQVMPNLARPDVAGTRAQLDATTLGIARSLVQDDRLSDGDRKAVEQIMVSGGLGESLPGAQAKLAALIAVSAYRQKFANQVRTGGAPLPPLDGAMLGRLVDDGAISPAVAQSYSTNVLARPSQDRASGRPVALVPARQAPPAQSDLPLVNSPEEAMRLPSGTKFRTPDGREKVRP